MEINYKENLIKEEEDDIIIKEPRDRYNIAYMLFFIQGVGTLLPWNFFITANGYFRYKFQNDGHVINTFENAFSVGSMWPNTLGLLFNLYLTAKGNISRSVRALTCLTITILCFIVTAALVEVDTHTWTNKFFAVTMTSVVINNFCIGVYQGTIFGVAGGVGPVYMLATVRGVAMGGIFTTTSNLISLACSPSEKTSAFAFFMTATLVAMICVIAYLSMFSLKVLKFHFNATQRVENLPNGIRSVSPFSDTTSELWSIFKQVYPQALSVCSVFMISTCVMPAVISNIKSVNAPGGSPYDNKYYSDLVCFLIFNVGDFSGRITAGYIKLAKANGYKLPLLCLTRLVFIPLFMLCNYQPRSNLTVLFNNDYIPVIINLFFSVSNGYLASLCMMYGPDQVREKDKETAGAIMQMFVSLGLSVGAAFSYAVVYII